MPSDARKFRFVSPGIFLNEIDQSQIPAEALGIGPVVVGRALKGPGMIPTRVGSFSEFTSVFGEPLTGRGNVSDVWRQGNHSAPTYAAYAAQAYLRAGVGPVTFLRLMGTQHPDAVSESGLSRSDSGYAGWATVKTIDPTVADNGGAYGLFLWPSSSTMTTVGNVATGSLAAVWYINNGGAIVLSGNTPGQANAADATYLATISGAATVVESDSNGLYRAIVYNSSRTEEANVSFSLQESSDKFARKVFNTNPQLVAGGIEDSGHVYSYWLGETFERYLSDNSLSNSQTMGAILALASGSIEAGLHERDHAYRDAHSGWFFAQSTNADTASYQPDNQQKLFKFVGINGYGEWLQNNIKISITNIKYSKTGYINHGTFDVIIRKASDSDMKPVILERFSNCNLDPGSPNYIAVLIGDTYQTYDTIENRYREFGNYPNRSEYIRVVMHETVDLGSVDDTLLPFGVYGPPRFPGFLLGSGSAGGGNGAPVLSLGYGQGNAGYAIGAKKIAEFHADNVNNCVIHSTGSQVFNLAVPGGAVGAGAFGTASIVYPAVGTRASASDDSAIATTNAYFGLHTGKSATSTVFDDGYSDYLRPLGRQVVSDGTWADTYGQSGYGDMEPQWVFSLDEIRLVTGSAWATTSKASNISDAFWETGSHAAGDSWTAGAMPDGVDAVQADGLTASYKNVLDSKVNRFTTPLWGGFDGFDIREREPMRNTILDGNSPTETTSYVYYTYRRAIDMIADPEVVAMNAVTIPGLWEENLTKYLIDTVEARADSLAIIDVKGGLYPRHEMNDTITTRKGNLDTVISSFQARNLNSSYGCAYYPWVKVRDDQTGTYVDMPPSVVALGVMANTERTADVWFAPAGFRRGGLSVGAAGLTVTGIETKLTSQNRDDLYEININPIASFPAEGIVIFGQKTLQATRSALDRINVRRLMIFVKRGISQIASTTLFQPNVQATWNTFKGRANTFLSDVKIRFGVDDFKIILDETTTTPDLVDRNIMYAKIFIKPTRAIEYIAIDFIITRSGASFED